MNPIQLSMFILKQKTSKNVTVLSHSTVIWGRYEGMYVWLSEDKNLISEQRFKKKIACVIVITVNRFLCTYTSSYYFFKSVNVPLLKYLYINIKF